MRKITSELNSLFWTQLYGALNDNLFKSALVILITYKNVSLFGVNPASMVALCGGIFILPFFLVSATSGQLADKLDKVWLTYRIKEAEVVIAILGALGILLGNYYLMLLVLFLLGLQSTFFGPIKYSLIPHYTPKEQLVFANAMVSSGTFVAILLGTIIGGVAASLKDNYWPLVVVLLVIAYLGLHYAKKLPLENIGASESIQIDWNFFTSTWNILKLVFQNPLIALLIVGLSWFWFMGAGLLSLLPLIAKNIFHGSETIATIMLFTFTVGMGVGPFLLEKVTKGKVRRWIIPVSLIAMTLVIFDLSIVIQSVARNSYLIGLTTEVLDFRQYLSVPMSLRVIVDLFLLSLFGGMFTVPQFAELQRITNPGELSRIVAGNNIINALAMVSVSVLLMAFHQLRFSISQILAILGVFNIVMCIILLYFYKEEFNKFWRL
ncbi:MAG: MFS transporter [Bdellovibrionales bacterium]|nr:MFS transporter [Bdellovibrionales bacterium]